MALGDIVGIAVALVVVAIVLSFGVTIYDDIREDQTAIGSEDNMINATGLFGAFEVVGVGDFLPTFVIVMIGVAVIGVITTVFVSPFRIGGGDEDDEEDYEKMYQKTKKELNQEEYDNALSKEEEIDDKKGLGDSTHQEVEEKYKSKEKYPFHKDGICQLTGKSFDDDKECEVCNK